MLKGQKYFLSFFIQVDIKLENLEKVSFPSTSSQKEVDNLLIAYRPGEAPGLFYN